MPELRIRSATHSAIFKSVVSVDQTKVHLADPASGSRVVLPRTAFPFCELDSQSVVTVTVTNLGVEEEEPTLPGLVGLPPLGKLS